MPAWRFKRSRRAILLLSISLGGCAFPPPGAVPARERDLDATLSLFEAVGSKAATGHASADRWGQVAPPDSTSSIPAEPDVIAQAKARMAELTEQETQATKGLILAYLKTKSRSEQAAFLIAWRQDRKEFARWWLVAADAVKAMPEERIKDYSDYWNRASATLGTAAERQSLERPLLGRMGP